LTVGRQASADGRHDPGEQLERRCTDVEGYDVGNRTNPAGVGGAHMVLRPRVET